MMEYILITKELDEKTQNMNKHFHFNLVTCVNFDISTNLIFYL